MIKIIGLNAIFVIIFFLVYSKIKRKFRNELFQDYFLLNISKFILLPLFLFFINSLIFLYNNSYFNLYSILYSIFLLIIPTYLIIYKYISLYFQKKKYDNLIKSITPLINEIISKEHLDAKSISFQINVMSKNKDGTTNIDIILRVPNKNKEYKNLKESMNKELNDPTINRKYKFNSFLNSPFKKKVNSLLLS